MKRIQVLGAVTLAATALLVAAPTAEASSMSFSFSKNLDPGGGGASLGHQFVVDVIDGGAIDGGEYNGRNLVTFRFMNTGPEASVVARIYFYDGALIDSAPAGFTSSDGALFSLGAAPPNLPGIPGGDDGPTLFYSTSAEPAAPDNGLNPGDSIEISFALKDGVDWNAVIASIHSGMGGTFDSDTDLVIGMHVIAFADGSSNSFIIIPLPAPVWMGLAGLVGVGVLRRRMIGS